MSAAMVQCTGGPRIRALDCFDVRFPTSAEHHGSDAMNPDPDYSAAYVVLRTDPGTPDGHAICFTIGRGNDIVVAAIEALRAHVVDRPVADIVTNLGGFSASLTSDSQLRWLGPDKGVMHMAIGAVINAAWDLAAKLAGRPLWRLLAGMTPEDLVALVDFRYIDDALTPAEALDILRSAQPGRGERIAALLDGGYPAYTTTPGWIGYSDDKLSQLSRQAVSDGFTQIKLKVGGNADVRRLALARAAVGPDVRIAVDANQRWTVAQAISAIQALAPYDPYWVEEPTSPDEMYVDHLHEHFTDPVRVTGGRYLAPSAPGFSATLRPESLRDYQFPGGPVWQQIAGGELIHGR
jgi:L-fuconate dehydratase